jgi:hypothetical protein
LRLVLGGVTEGPAVLNGDSWAKSLKLSRLHRRQLHRRIGAFNTCQAVNGAALAAIHKTVTAAGRKLMFRGDQVSDYGYCFGPTPGDETVVIEYQLRGQLWAEPYERAVISAPLDLD